MRRDHGFTLMEVLVAAFMLALGVAGASLLQTAALRTRHEAGLMGHAVRLAASLADRMRANAQQMQQSDGDNPYLALRYDATVDGPPPAPAQLCYAQGSDCDSAQLAAHDVFEVEQALYDALPGARLRVCRDGAVWDAGRHALRWECAGGAAAPVVVKVGWRAKQADGSDSFDGAGEFAPSVAIALAGVAP